MSGPTPRQRQVYEAAHRLGSQTAAGKELGLSPGAVSSAVTKYRAATGAPHPTPLRALVPGARDHQLSIRDAAALMPARLTLIEDAVRAQTGQVDTLAAEVHALRGLIHDMLQRQPLILEVRPAHQRKADGGLGGHAEVRRVRRAIA